MGKARLWVAALWVVIGWGGGARGETLRGNVAAEDGSAAAGARVWAAKLWIQQLERVEAKADGRGRFALDLGPGDWLIEANLGDQGLAQMAHVKLAEGQSPEPLSLRLTPQGTLRARLIEEETGKPIAGGRLVLDNGLDPVTDRDGRLEVHGLDRSRYHESFVVAPGRERKRVLFEMSEQPVTELELRVPRGGRVTGRVLDVDGKPIPGAFVGRTTSGSILSLTGLWVRADDQGRFDFDGLVLNRTTWLNAVAAGYEDGQRNGVQRDADAGSTAIDFRLAVNPAAKRPKPDASAKAAPAPAKAPNRRDVSGVVVGPDDKPVAGAAVRWGVNQGSDTIEARTDAEGKFRLALVPDAQGVVTVIPAGADLAPDVTTVAEGGDRDVRVALARGHTAKGVVQDDHGVPFSDVTVVPIVGGVGHSQLALRERIVKTDDRGRFDLAGLPESGVTFTFLRMGVSDLRDHALDLDKENTVLMSAAGAIRGKVVDHEGKPVRNFRVLLNVSRERRPADKYGGFFAGFTGTGLSYTSDDGSFLVRNLGAGSVQRVTVIAPGHGEGSIDRVTAEPLNRLTPDKALEFRLPPPHALKVRVVEEGSGEAIPGARVALIYGDPSLDKNFSWGYHDTSWGDSVHARADEQGVATFSPLSFEGGTLLIRLPGYGRAHLGWRDRSPELTVKLKPEAVVAGELTDPATDKPLESAYIQLMSSTGGLINGSVEPGSAGCFRLGELPEGTYQFSISTNSGTNLHHEQLTLKAGQEVSRSLSLSPAKAAVGRLFQQLVAPKPKPPEKRFKPGDAAPEFAAQTLDGKPVALKDYRGKYVLLDFWATWCGPCIDELPHLRAAHEAFGKDPKFVMISLSLDASKDDVTKFLKEKDQPWVQVFLGSWDDDPVTKRYGVTLIPSVLLLDPEGKIVAQDLRGEGIKSAVAKALKRD